MNEPNASTGGYHEVRAEVRYVDTDQMGYAHHSCYVAWCEMGRIAWLRDRGTPYGQLEARGVMMPVIQLSLRYLAPGRFEDQLVIQTRLAEFGRASVVFENRVLREEPADARRILLVEGRIELACVGRDGRVQRLPNDLRARFGGSTA